MSLRVITGLANAGKAGEVVSQALSAAQRGEVPIIAVPTVADVRRLESEFSAKAPLGVRVLTLHQLVGDLWSLFGDGRRVVGGSTRDALLRLVLRESDASDIGAAMQAPGFARLLSRLAAECPPVSAPDVARSGPLRELGRLIDSYRDRLASAGLVEAGWLADLMAVAQPPIGGPLGVARFDTLAPRDLRLLVGLAHTNEVTVTPTWQQGFAPTRANDGALALLEAAATERVVLAEPPANSEIQRLGRGLYQGPVALTGTGEVVAALASGSEAEAALIAQLTADEIEDGVRPERIVIGFSNAGQRKRELENAFLSHGISVAFELTTPFAETQFGRAWLALMSLATGGGGRPEALTFLASPYSGVSSDSVQLLDLEWRRCGTREPRELLRSIDATGSAAGGACTRARTLAGEGLSRKNVVNWQELAEYLLESAWSADGTRHLGDASRQDAAAHQGLTRTLAEISMTATEPVPIGDVIAALAGLRVHEGGDEPCGSVQVCDFASIGSRRFDVVVLGGLTESEVSAAPREALEDELKSDSTRALEGTAADRLRLRFYSIVTRARRRLYLVRQEADSEGRERRASALWEDVIDAYRPVGTSRDEQAAQPPRCERLARADIEALAPALTIRRRNARGRAGEMRLREPNRSTVMSRAGLSALANATVFSATEIEAYLECPHKWFYTRVVRPEEIDTAFDARELGTRAHRLLAAFYRRLAQADAHRRVTPESAAEALALFDLVAADETRKLAKAAGLSEELAAARATEWARNVVGQDARLLPGFVPEHVEFAFGDEDRFQFAGYAFRGRIDRIDTSPSSVFVTDYKSSSEVTGLGKLEAEAKVQAVIYARAAEALLGRPVSGSAYRSMRSGRMRGFWRSDLLQHMPEGMCEEDAIGAEGYLGLVERTESRVATAVSGMLGGRVERVPAVKGACKFCGLSATCEGARP